MAKKRRNYRLRRCANRPTAYHGSSYLLGSVSDKGRLCLRLPHIKQIDVLRFYFRSHDGTVLLRGAVNGLLSIDVYQQCTMDDVGHWWTQRRHLGSGSPIEQITVFQDEGLPSIGRGKAGEKTFRFIVRTDALFIVTVTVGVSVSITVENVFLEQPHPVSLTFFVLCNK